MQNYLTDVRPKSVEDLNPFTHGVLALVLITGALLFGLPFLFINLIVVFGLAAATGIFSEFFTKWVKTALVLTLVVMLFQILLVPGDTVLYEFFVFSITNTGVERAITLGSRLLGVFTPIIYFLEVVSIDDFVLMMEQRGVSPKVTYVISSTFNMIPEMKDRLERITSAQKSRGIETEGNLFTRMKAFLPIIGPVVLSSVVAVEEKTMTLEVRGFYTEGLKSRLDIVPDSSFDQTIRRVLWVVFWIIVIGRVLLWVL